MQVQTLTAQAYYLVEARVRGTGDPWAEWTTTSTAGEAGDEIAYASQSYPSYEFRTRRVGGH